MHPVSHLPVDAPICLECQALELTFFDPTCPGCRAALTAQETTIAHIFAALRQWVPQVQQAVDFLVDEALRRGAHPDDRDILTDMTLLMYACKAGAGGVGDATTAAAVAEKLVDLGADLSLKCKWTGMIPLHYAAYFDVAPVVEKLLMKSKGADVDTPCAEYENGTALHIAAANLSCEAAKALLAFGADPEVRDELARVPFDCIPDAEEFATIPEAEELVMRMEHLLSGKELTSLWGDAVEAGAVSGRTALKALGLQVGDRVLVKGDHDQTQQRLGTLKFCGTTDFAPGVWAGIALDRADGKNDGSVKGVVYFRCKPDHGVFVQAGKVAKVGKSYREDVKPTSRNNIVNYGRVDTSHVSSRLTERLDVIEDQQEIRMGDRVLVKDVNAKDITRRGEDNQTAEGTVRFIGEVDFDNSENKWFGVELDLPVGRHDGTVQGVRYFAAADNCGLFVTESKLAKLTISNMTRSRQSLSSSREEDCAPENIRKTSTIRRTESVKTSPMLRSNFQKKSGDKNGSITGLNIASRPASVLSHSSVRSKNPSMIRTTKQVREEGWQTVPAQNFSKFQKKVPKKFLEVGTSVICVHTKEMGIVKFVGRVDFAPGIWVGLELRDPKGRHDGEVQGRRYFQCRQNHGVVLRPKLISVHGINGEKLLKPESEYPF